MKVLFLHNNFPAQYRWLALKLAEDKENQVLFGSIYKNFDLPNIKNVHYKPSREAGKGTHHYLINAESAVLNGQAAYRLALGLQERGFTPDIICAHAGWGPGHFMKEVFPDTPLLDYFEWFYDWHSPDVAFINPGQEIQYDIRCRLRMKSTALLTDLNACDWGVVPTQFQAAQLPKIYRDHKISVLHDGINTDWFQPDPNAKCVIGDLDLSKTDEIITYAARGFEEYRGFMQFMEAVSIAHKKHKSLHVVIAGDDRVVYGAHLPEGDSYKKRALEKFEFDEKRLHFVGSIPLHELRLLFQCSKAHVYLTVPFVLSWSMLEAMASGCLIIGSNTAPVTEFIQHERNGLLVDFHSPGEIAKKMITAVKKPKKNASTT